ncbi:hypothetical protein [Serratia aquatilis]|uniref:Uncharacterized protein n=1 Tax=Serratia aquatilis TaxID=1737515 RepID=A0ABV6E9J5_9GAMM
MKKVIFFELKELHKNIAAMSINGEVAGFVVIQKKEDENLFTISHRGKSLGPQHCPSCAFESIARHYERIPADVEIDLIGRQRVINRVEIKVARVH